MSLSVRQSTNQQLRCAICHDESCSDLRSCVGCQTQVCSGCIQETGNACPTRGCRQYWNQAVSAQRNQTSIEQDSFDNDSTGRFIIALAGTTTFFVLFLAAINKTLVSVGLTAITITFTMFVIWAWLARHEGT